MKIDLEKLARDRAASDHSIFAPSSSAMWLTCSGSLIPNLLAPDTAGIDAAYGTVGHEVTETWLRSGKRPSHLIGEVRQVQAGGSTYAIEIDEEMVEYAADCVEWVQDIPGKRFIEQKVYFSRLTPIRKQGGTADLFFLAPGRLVIRDWKFGKGVRVFAKDNTQAQLYALGVFFKYDPEYRFKRINIGIGQPRLNHFEEWEISRKQLLDFAEYVRERAHAAWALEAPRTPSPKGCQWCKVRKTCPALMRQAHDLALDTFSDMDDADTGTDLSTETLRPVPAAELTTEQLGRIYAWRRTMELYFKDVGEELLRRMNHGEQHPAWKVVEGRSRQDWRSEEEAISYLARFGIDAEELTATKLVSPNQALAVLKRHGIGGKLAKQVLARLVHKPPGAQTLVPTSDKRAATADLALETFADIADDDA